MDKDKYTIKYITQTILNGTGGYSVPYSEPRTILNYLNDPLVAWAYGFNGCIGIVKGKRRHLGFEWGNSLPISRYGKESIRPMDPQDILKIINESKLFTDKWIVKDFKKVKINQIEWPELGRFKLKYLRIEGPEDSPTWQFEVDRLFRVVKLMSGKYRCEIRGYSDFKYCTPQELLRAYDLNCGKPYNNEKIINKSREGDLPKEIEQKLRKQVVFGNL